jgi:hypothetical protein
MNARAVISDMKTTGVVRQNHKIITFGGIIE